MNNNAIYIKCKIDEKLNNALRKILTKHGVSQQEFLEKKIKEFVLDNIDLIIPNESKEVKKWEILI